MSDPIWIDPSPFMYESGDYQDNVIRITIPFDNTTHVLQEATTFRDADCVYRHIYFGIGPDDTPNSTPIQFDIPVGTDTITIGQLAAVGLNTAEDIYAVQVTAGP